MHMACICSWHERTEAAAAATSCVASSFMIYQLIDGLTQVV
uniref:Uncharacterized protein n=1 Tax=Arundo donax TaxID=35708 RepID=A0A0A9C6S6_ARUDO